MVDATRVQAKARAALVALARSHDRDVGSHVVRRQRRDLKRSLGRLRKEGFRRVHVLTDAEQVAAVEIVRERPWNDRAELHGPFDLIGDVHGCASELRTLLIRLGWQIRYDEGLAVGATHPEDRTAVFVGDLVDRGPDTPGVLRLVMGMVADGTALCVCGTTSPSWCGRCGGPRSPCRTAWPSRWPSRATSPTTSGRGP